MSRPRYMRPPPVEMTEDQRLATKACRAANLPSPYDLGRAASTWTCVADGEWHHADGAVLHRHSVRGWEIVERDDPR